MKKVLLCNVRMNRDAQKAVYKSEDKFFPVADTEVRYPVMAFLEQQLTKNDEIKVILLAKKETEGHYINNIKTCKEEIEHVADVTGAAIETDIIYTPFREDLETHSDLLLQILEKVDKGSEIMVDMTYGPKDLVIVLFSALDFLERFYKCEIANIIYGKAEKFIDNKPADTRICDMSPLYYVSKVMNSVKCSDPEKAVNMLKILLDR